MHKRSLPLVVATAVFTTVLLGAVHSLWAADPPLSFADGETLSAAKLNALVTRLDALEKVNAPGTLPAGTIVAFGGTEVPSGWLRCDGGIIARSAEPALFAAIGTAWGTPDGANFNLPDLRGRFLRGVDLGADRDRDRAAREPAAVGGNKGDAVGSVQNDLFASHTHKTTSDGQESNRAAAGSQINTPGGTDESTSAPAGGSETRPKNANVTYIIKR